MNNYICKYCKKEFCSKTKNRKFCSQSCSTKYNNNKRNYYYMKGDNNPAKRLDVRNKIKDKLKGRNITWGNKISISLKNSYIAKETRKRAVKKAQISNLGRSPWNKNKKYICENRKNKLMGDLNPSKRPEVRDKISNKLKQLYKEDKLTCGFKS